MGAVDSFVTQPVFGALMRLPSERVQRQLWRSSTYTAQLAAQCTREVDRCHALHDASYQNLTCAPLYHGRRSFRARCSLVLLSFSASCLSLHFNLVTSPLV